MSKTLYQLWLETPVIDKPAEVVFSEIERRLSALETEHMRLAGAHNSGVDYVRLSSFKSEELSEPIIVDVPAPIQPIRIRPDDICVVKYSNNPNTMILRLDVVMMDSDGIEYISPIQPVNDDEGDLIDEDYTTNIPISTRKAKVNFILPEQSWDGWNRIPEDAVWWYGRLSKEVRKIDATELEPGDLWQPIDPNHPDVPPMKPEGM